MTEFELFQALRPHYPAREYALLAQTANGTGAGAFRHCDALALSLWPSRGLHLHGFEIKTHRGDWLRELKQPEKAEEIAQYCNYWWIIAAGPFVKAEELPQPWGLMVYDEKTGLLKKTKHAPYREAIKPDLPFVAAMLRKAQDVYTPEAALTEKYDAGYAKGKQDARVNEDYDLGRLRRLGERVREIEKASGIMLDTWIPPKKLGKAINLVVNGNLGRHKEALRCCAESVLKDLDKADFPDVYAGDEDEDQPTEQAAAAPQANM